MPLPAEYNVEIFHVRSDIALAVDLKRYEPREKQVFRIDSELYKDSRLTYTSIGGQRIKKAALMKPTAEAFFIINAYSVYCFKDDIDKACQLLMERHKKDVAEVLKLAQQMSAALENGYEALDREQFFDFIQSRTPLKAKE